MVYSWLNEVTDPLDPHIIYALAQMIADVADDTALVILAYHDPVAVVSAL